MTHSYSIQSFKTSNMFSAEGSPDLQKRLSNVEVPTINSESKTSLNAHQLPHASNISLTKSPFQKKVMKNTTLETIQEKNTRQYNQQQSEKIESVLQLTAKNLKKFELLK
eukprot:CAMPEP_0170563244 /NCGR_PEP_ID=MMETSP0211-20121228/65319_1 /TAXON_ID=311385 /ORGANISM="Pseudokeronopsis sp., Strain OXSARD2" /LENGTH=109 /DNA_ID=CAMNT_0010881235 /DNA_START=155 /DNA_END=484 /DNA_ORIENTATION=+